MTTGHWVLVAVIALLYFLPGLNASSRGHHNSGAIWVLNIFLGWTFLGWVLALVWSSTAVQRPAPAASTSASPTRTGSGAQPSGKSHATKKCPMCAEDIRAEAIRCRFCGADLWKA